MNESTGAHASPPPKDFGIVYWSSFEAVLFDLDGVITPTAEVHRRAWAALFADHDFTDEDYLRHIDGKPRYEGVEAFLAARGIDLPAGEIDDPPEAETICGLGNRKDRTFRALLAAGGLEPYEGTMRVVGILEELGTPRAVVSSSRNALHVLQSVGLAQRFDVLVDGATAEVVGLAGKPAPDMFTYGAEMLGCAPATCAVIEDAEVGVAAGVAGHFGQVIGVDRGGNRDALSAAGAHLVVSDLIETLRGG